MNQPNAEPESGPARGRIFEIQRFCIHDGPGIRTTLFLKGCPLACLWCHNPEGREAAPQLSFAPDKCIGCRWCFDACTRGAHGEKDGRHVLDRARCQVCGKCAAKCPAGALEVVGREITVAEALAEALKDRAFYETSGGGVTLSGGEPLQQPDFSREFLRAAKAAGLHTVVETCGFAAGEIVESVRPFTDLFLFDLKETDPERHARYAGVPLEPIRANLRRLHDAGAAVLVRLPIVPGVNDRREHLAGVAEVCRPLPNLRGVEVLPYHRLGLSKPARLGLTENFVATPPDAATVAGWVKTLRALGVRVINDIAD